jgi:hypothetical protein
VESPDTDNVSEIGDYIWPRFAMTLRELIKTVRQRFPQIGAHCHRWNLPNARISGYASFMTGPPATADEDVVVSVESYREKFTFPAGTPPGELDRFIREYFRSKPQQATKRFYIASNIWGPEMGTIDGPEIWIDLEQDRERIHHDLDAWIEVTRSFVLDNTSLIFAEIAKAESRLSNSSKLDR